MGHQTASLWDYILVLLRSGFVILYITVGLLLVLGIAFAVGHAVHGALLTRRFRATFGKEGKVAVLVYSDSPHWKGYIEEQLLPQVRDRVVTVNWSQRSQWKHHAPLEAQMFQYWGGPREFNPMAIIVPRRGRVRLIRFWKAFREFKHGKPEQLEGLRAQLQEAIGAA